MHSGLRTRGAGAQDAAALLDLADNAQWNDGRYRAALFRHLCDSGCQRLVVRQWQKRRTVVESHADSCAEVGRALLKLGREKEARNLLAGWRERADATMGIVANYVQCFPRQGRKHLRAVLSACQDALVRLPHDHHAKYLAHVQAEMCALLGDTEAFRETWVKHRDYFSGTLEYKEWFESQREYLLGEIPRMGRFLEKDRTELFTLRRKRGSLKSSRSATSGIEIRSWEWLHHLLQIVRHRLLR